jgi:hypothetical protein
VCRDKDSKQHHQFQIVKFFRSSGGPRPKNSAFVGASGLKQIQQTLGLCSMFRWRELAILTIVALTAAAVLTFGALGLIDWLFALAVQLTASRL